NPLTMLDDADDSNWTHITLPRQQQLVAVAIALNLGSVATPSDAVRQLTKLAIMHDAANRTGHKVAHGVGLLDRAPRVRDERLAIQADALALHVHDLNTDLDLLADGENIARVVHVLPVQLGDVDEPVHPADVDEGAVVHDL